MKMLKWAALLVGISLMTLGQPVQAQDYKTSLGLRISPFWGFTLKHYTSNTDALEVILHNRWNAFKITGLWERHTPAFGEAGLKFYYGAGAHLGASGSRYYADRFSGGGRFILGLDGIIGLEYTMQDKSVPLNFSLDWKPTLDFVPYTHFWGSELALSVRYIF